MSEILNLAKSFQQKSKQQAESIEQTLQDDFKRHENAIKEALKSSTTTIENAISGQSHRAQRLVLKTWLGCGIAVASILLLAQGLIWYQGVQIADNWQTISQQRQQLATLEKNGSKITLADCGGRLCIPAAKDGKGWTRSSDQRPLFIPEGY
ncbi:MAG: MbeB family mobilization protein [Oceanisphaera sp.]|nr:MbeB family mobilization protein [Oceanisphaera sp.]